MLAYLMLFAAVFNAVCLHNAFFFPIDFSIVIYINAFCFHASSLGY